MRNGGKTCVLSLSIWMLLSTSVSAHDDDSDVPCPSNCVCNSYGTEFNCSGIHIDATNYVYPRINCDFLMLDCTKLPKRLNVANRGQLNFFEIERCSVNSPLQCVLPSYKATGVSKLSLLDLLTPLDEKMLQGLGTLKTLIIVDNGLGKNCNETNVLARRTFQDTPLLSALQVDKYCNELRLDEGVISSLANFKRIKVAKARKLVLGSKALSNLPLLWDVILRESNITELPEDVFYGSNNILNLDLRDNELTYLSDGVFYNLSKLEVLRISNNKLEKITSKLFASLTRAKEIYLDGNRIRTLPDYMFSSSTMQVVSFARNRIENVTANSFSMPFLHLTELDLSHNMLSWNCWDKTQKQNRRLGYSVLADLIYLEILHLGHNRIQTICDDWKRVSQYLDLSYNRLERLTEENLMFWRYRVVVKFNNNNISTVFPPLNSQIDSIPVFILGSNPLNCDCHLYILLNSPFSYQYNLEGAQCNQPQSLNNVSLLKLADQKRLDSLTCSVDGSESCECLFRPNQHRIECSCTDTRNITLPKPTFDEISEMKVKLLKSQPDLTGLPSFVTKLDLSGLGLNSIPDIPNTVRELDIRNNSLQIIPSDIYNKSYTLLLENNPLQCDCSGMDNVRLLQIYYQKLVDYSEVLCSDGFVVKGKDPNTLCHVYYTTAIGVTCSVGAMILAITIVLMYKYLPEVQVLLFHIGLRCLVKEEWIDNGKIYDIFLSYTVKDEHFVRGILLPKLDEMKYKVCEHTRDWEIGMQIPEQIYTSVANSKKTLFVISENFLKSVWVLVEFNATILQEAKDRRNRAVIILLEDVNLDDAPITIKRHIALTTYIKWDANDNSFWKRLQNALPKKLTTEEIKKRQKAVKAVKSLGTGIGLVLNEEGRLVNAAVQRTTGSPSATVDIINLETYPQNHMNDIINQ